MHLFRLLLLIVVAQAWSAAWAQPSPSVSCGFLGRKIQFADGGEVCVKDTPLFKRSGLIDTAPSTTYEARISGAKTYAIATTANPNACPFSTFIAWDWTGHDASSALPGCNARLAEAIKATGSGRGAECKCELLVDSGKSPLSLRAFLERTGSLDRQLMAGGKPLEADTRVADGAAVVAPSSTAPVAVQAASGQAAAQARQAEEERRSREQLAKQEEERRAREQLARQEADRRAEQQRLAQVEAARLEEERKTREQLAKQEEDRKAREQLARQEADRRAEQQRLAQVEAARLEEERKTREQLAKQEEDRKAREQLAQQEVVRRAEQDRLAKAEADRRLQDERRLMDEERARMARADQERTQEQARLARELAELRRMLEERTRAEAAARASLSGPSQYTERVALIIGNRSYVVSPLVNPINDARAVKERLQAVGFKVLYFEDLMVAQIGDVLEQLHATLKPGAAFVFFYAGHGTQIDGENFFPAVDAKMTSAFQMPTQSLELARIIKVAESRKAAVNLLILDACRDNPWQVASRTAVRGLSKIEPAAGTLVFYATRPGSVAADGSKAGHGLFTYHLLQHLGTPLTPVEQVFKRVAADVLKESAGKQVPWVEGQLVGDFTFVER